MNIHDPIAVTGISHRGRAMLTLDQIAEIGNRYDGTTETLDALVAQFQVKRHNVIAAAKKAGYKTSKKRKSWTAEEDKFLQENWGRMAPDEIADALGRTYLSCQLRKKRLGISTRDFEDLTIRDIEELTKIDHRIWHRFIDDGWLKAWQQPRRGAVPVTRVSVDNLKKFFTDHPEVFNYQASTPYVRGVLELNGLPDAPKFKRVTCQSESFTDGERQTKVGKIVHHGDFSLENRIHQFSMESCATIGGTSFWTPIYEVSPSCPRCGCITSRFSESAIFTDDTPDEAEKLAIVAAKLGLKWIDGGFVDAEGNRLSDENLLRYVFNTKRNAGKAFRVFRRLLEAGLKVAPPNPVPESRLLPNILSYDLRPRQQSAFVEFLRTGNIGVYWPPGHGKMYFLGMIYTRIPGRHVLFVHTDTIREAWIAHMKAYAPAIKVRECWKPKCHEVTVFNADGNERCVIEIYAYMTRHHFSGNAYSVAGYDEAHFLPGTNAHRLSLIECEFRVGLTATPFREDGRADLIQIMTGTSVGEDWDEMMEAGEINNVPVQVIVVQDLEHKYQVLGKMLGKHRTIVFSDSIENGKRIASENRIPFVFSESENRLETVHANRVVCMSRVGDCGIDVPDLEEVIEFNFHHGSRAQELQRYGRLLHAKNPVRHVVLMTASEFTLYHKRLKSLESKGFGIEVTIRRPGRRGRPVSIRPLSQAAIQPGNAFAMLISQLEASASSRKKAQ